MIASMTAYGRRTLQKEWGQATWEIRSVNHRYLDLTFKLPEIFRAWESEWRTLACHYLHRGKVECNLNFFPSHLTAPRLMVNTDLVDQLISSCQSVAIYPEVSPIIKVMELLRWPEVLIPQASDLSELKKPLTDLFIQALQDLVQTRNLEGSQLAQMLKTKLTHATTQIALVREKVPLCLLAQKQKLTQKIQEISTGIDPSRLEQELVLFAQKIDVDEEVDRLETHIKAVMQVLEEQGATIGRRLDFLMQEMNREANTLAAKSQDKSIIQAAIELKVLIEQMREQIQNVE